MDSNSKLELGRLRDDEIRSVAELHFEFFGNQRGQGNSLANLGVDFLEQVFYGLSRDNPHFFVDVIRHRGRLLGFSVYSSNYRQVSRHIFSRHFSSLIGSTTRLFIHHPKLVSSQVLGNLRFITESIPPEVREIPGWYLLIGVKLEANFIHQKSLRSTKEKRSDRQHQGLATQLVEHMERTLWDQGCRAYWAAPFVHNLPSNELFRKIGAEVIAKGSVQGIECNYYRRQIEGPKHVDSNDLD